MRSSLILLAAAMTAASAHAQIAAVTDTFGYTGTVVRYNSEAEARARINPTNTFTIAGNRDLYLRVDDGYVAQEVHIGTLWAFGNLGDQNHGFVQIPDGSGPFPNVSAWWDSTKTQFTFDLNGLNAQAPLTTRLWSGVDSAGNDTGKFLNYYLHFTATGLTPALFDVNTFYSASAPTGLTGTFQGIFENTSTGAPGFYDFDFALNLNSWATQNGANQLPYSLFAAPAPIGAVPEPSTYGLFGIAALAGIVAFRRFAAKRA